MIKWITKIITCWYIKKYVMCSQCGKTACKGCRMRTAYPDISQS